MAGSRIGFVFFLLVAVTAIGALGYHRIEGFSVLDSVYMTVITISTVGFREVAPLSPQGKMFTIALIVVGVGLVVFAFTAFADWMVQTMLRVQHAALRRTASERELLEEDREGQSIFETVRDNARMATVALGKGSALAGKTKAEVLRKTGVIILAVDAGRNRFDADVPLQKKVKAGSTLLVMGTESALKKLERQAGE